MPTMSNLRTVVAAAGLVALGFLLAPRQQPAAAPSTHRQAPIQGFAPAGVDRGALRAEIRAAVHDELGGQAPEVDADEPEHPDPAAAPVEPSDEELAAADRGRVFVDEAIARGRFTAEDAMALRPMLASMSHDDAMDVRYALARAVNSETLAIDGPDSVP